jgi:tetratricopeptide (TPR) repeat protein/TolB-like protein
VKKSRLVQVLVAYIAISWGILQVAEILQEAFELPPWLLPVAVVLLVIGLVIIAATAWVQSHPLTEERAARDEVPDSWEVEPGEITAALAQGKLPHLTWARALLGGAVAFSLLFGFAGLYVVIKDRGQSFAPTEAIASDAGLGVAVLPFSVSGEQLDEWREGMVNLLSTNLDGAAGLRAINSRTVLARWDELVGHAGRVDESTSLQVARAAGARYALMGSAVGIGPSVRLTADVYDVESGASLGQGRVEGSPDSVLALVDRLSIDVISSIVGGGRGELPSLNLASITTNSVPALKAYLEGEALFRAADFAGAIQAYERAVSTDSTFALAHSRLGDAYGWKENVNHPLAVQGRERAMSLADRLPERAALFLRIDAARFTYEAVELTREAVRRYPDDPEAWYLLGEIGYHQTSQSLATREETDEAFARAVELDPQFAPYRIHGFELAFSVNDSALAGERVEEFEQLAGPSEHTRRARLVLALAYGDSAAWAAARGVVDTLNSEEISSDLIALGRLDARSWRVAEELHLALKRRGELSPRLSAAHAWLSLQHGALDEGMARFDEPGVPPSWGICAPAILYVQGFPVAEERVESVMNDAVGDTTNRFVARCGALYAAERHRWDDVAMFVSRLESIAGRFLESGDSSNARHVAALAQGARGIAEWKRGRPEAGLALLEAARRDNGLINLEFIGDLQLELGNYRDAVRYYRADWTWPVSRLKLARAYELLGDPDKARDAYAYFVEAWSDADPALQPMVEQAKQAIVRLRGDSG